MVREDDDDIHCLLEEYNDDRTKLVIVLTIGRDVWQAYWLLVAFIIVILSILFIFIFTKKDFKGQELAELIYSYLLNLGAVI